VNTATLLGNRHHMPVNILVVTWVMTSSSLIFWTRRQYCPAKA